MTIRRLLRAAVLSPILACTLPMSAAYACSCTQPPGGDAPLEGTVFYGEIKDRDVDGRRAVYVVDVERVYAGDVGRRAEVRTSADGASCGLEIPGSGSAVFYARREGGVLTASLCSGTRSADGPPASLGEGRAPSATGTTDSTGDSEAGPRGDSRALPLAAGGFLLLAGLGHVAFRLRRPALTSPAPGPAA